jgi:hypothetical protein
MKRAILQSARIAELKEQAAEVARLARKPPAVELPRDARSHYRLLLLLARERRRNMRLVELLNE